MDPSNRERNSSGLKDEGGYRFADSRRVGDESGLRRNVFGSEQFCEFGANLIQDVAGWREDDVEEWDVLAQVGDQFLIREPDKVIETTGKQVCFLVHMKL